MSHPRALLARIAGGVVLAALGLATPHLLGVGDRYVFFTLVAWVLLAAFWLGTAGAISCLVAGLAGGLVFGTGAHLGQRGLVFAITTAVLVYGVERLRRAERRAHESGARLETFLDTAPLGLAFVDADAHLTHVNQVMHEILRGPAEARILSCLRHVLDTGEPLLDDRVVVPGGPGRGERVLSASYYPVRDASGTVFGAGASAEDVSGRARSTEGLRLLAETGALLESPLSADERLELLSRLVVPRYADACLIELNDPGGQRTAAVAHRDAASEAVMRTRRTAGRLPASAGYGMGHVIATGQVDWRAELDGSTDNPLDFRTYVIAPMNARGRTVGALCVARGEGRPPFDEADVALVEELAARAAIAVDNALLLAEQTAIARTLQDSLLPPHLPAIPGVELAGRYRSATRGTDVGGDFYDVFASPGGWTLVIGDVCGKGPQAAALTALARHTIRALAHDAPSPSAILRGVNDRLMREPAEQLLLTAAIVRLEQGPEGMRATVACAGHPLPVVVRADGAVAPLGQPGTLLGPFSEARFVDAEAVLEPGDALVLYTDGVTETRADGRLFGESGLHETLARTAGGDAHALADAVESAVERFGGEPSDDIAIVVAAVTGVHSLVDQ